MMGRINRKAASPAAASSEKHQHIPDRYEGSGRMDIRFTGLPDYQRFALAGTDDRSTRETAPREQAALQMPQP
jgi:hypothetical protein